MERSCRVCNGWHDLDDGWPERCTGHWKPATARSDIPAPMVMRDIEPYRSMITGECIQGRRQHRDHLRAHSCIEVGNETPKPRIASKAKSTRKELLHRILADKNDKQVQAMVKQTIKEKHV